MLSGTHGTFNFDRQSLIYFGLNYTTVSTSIIPFNVNIEVLCLHWKYVSSRQFDWTCMHGSTFLILAIHDGTEAFVKYDTKILINQEFYNHCCIKEAQNLHQLKSSLPDPSINFFWISITNVNIVLAGHTVDVQNWKYDFFLICIPRKNHKLIKFKCDFRTTLASLYPLTSFLIDV